MRSNRRFAFLDALQVRQDVCDVGVSVPQLASHCTLRHRDEGAVRFRIELGNRFGGTSEDLLADFLCGAALVRRFASQHFVKQRAERVNIAPRVFGVAGSEAR